MLIDEAGLTKRHAMELIRNSIEGRSDISGQSADSKLPEFGRLSFVDWIDRVSRTVSQSELLHVATKLRNELVHTGTTDWPLKKG